MHATSPAGLDSAALSLRLSELAGHERAVQVEFLIHLEEYDRRRAYLEAGFGSLWDYLTRSLHFREGATHRRIRTMRLLRRFPQVAEPLRAGRLCLTTAALLEPVLTEENATDLLARAAFQSKSAVEHLVVSLQPRSAPKDGLRRCPDRTQPATAALNVSALPLATPAPEIEVSSGTAALAATAVAASVTAGPASAAPAAAPADPPALVLVHEKRPTFRPVAADTYSLNVTVDAAFKRELDELTQLLSHKVPNGDLAAVLRQAVQCALEKHGKRKGALEPARKRKAAPSSSTAKTAPIDGRQPISAEVRRQVWKRDEGCCAWTGPDGQRCGSRWKLELDHIHAAALGGPSTVENLRLTCAAHNRLHAEQTFGLAHMARFRRHGPIG